MAGLFDFMKYDKDAAGAEVDAQTALELRRIANLFLLSSITLALFLLRAFGEALSVTFIPQAVYVVWGLVLLTGLGGHRGVRRLRHLHGPALGLVRAVPHPRHLRAGGGRVRVDPPPGDRARRARRRAAGRLAPAPRRQEEALSDQQAPRRRHPWRAAIIFLVIIVALFLILPRLAGQAHAIELIRDATPAWLVVAVAVECVSLLFYSLLFRRLLGLLRYPVTLGLALRINLAGLAAAHLFSAGGVGGAAVTYRVLQKRGMPHSLVLIAVIFQNAFAYLVLFALFAAGLTVLILRGQGGDAATVIAGIFVALLLVAAGYGFWLLNHPSSLRRRAHKVVAWLERRIKRISVDPAMLEEYLDGVVDGWRRLRREGWGHLKTVGLAVGYWGFDIVCLLLVMLAFHQTLSPDKVIIAYAVANVVGTFSPTPGGLGAVEGVMIALLVGFGMPSAAAVAVVLVYRLINFWLPIPAGLATYLSVR